jgi:hypothetical protein
VRGRAAPIAAVASLILIAVGCLAVMAQRERHALGSNWVRPVTFETELAPGERLCQPGAQLPAGTGGVGLRLRTFERPGPGLRLTIRAPGEAAVRGGLARGWRQGDVVVPIPELGAERRDARICLEQDGPGRLAIAGGSGVGDDARRDGKSIDGLIRLEYVEPEPETWFAVIPDIPDRIADARDALPAEASLPLFALLAVGVLGGALLLVVREGSR